MTYETPYNSDDHEDSMEHLLNRSRESERQLSAELFVATARALEAEARLKAIGELPTEHIQKVGHSTSMVSWYHIKQILEGK